MRAFIQHDDASLPTNVNTYSALRGFELLGANIVPFMADDAASVGARAAEDDVVAGYVGIVHRVWDAMGVERASVATWPRSLERHLGRRTWTSTLGEIRGRTDPVFIKPLANQKSFTGHVRNAGGCDAMRTAMLADETPVACSEVVAFESEWRCFILEGSILDVRRYRGSFRAVPDWNVLDECVAEFDGAPVGYAMDLGVLVDGRTVLVEVNDGYSLGSYGLAPVMYARLLEARWREVVQGR